MRPFIDYKYRLLCCFVTSVNQRQSLCHFIRFFFLLSVLAIKLNIPKRGTVYGNRTNNKISCCHFEPTFLELWFLYQNISVDRKKRNSFTVISSYEKKASLIDENGKHFFKLKLFECEQQKKPIRNEKTTFIQSESGRYDCAFL